MLNKFFNINRQTLGALKFELGRNKWFWISIALSCVIISAIFVWSLWKYLLWFLIGLLILLSDSGVVVSLILFFGGITIALLISKVILESIIDSLPDERSESETPRQKND